MHARSTGIQMVPSLGRLFILLPGCSASIHSPSPRFASTVEPSLALASTTNQRMCLTLSTSRWCDPSIKNSFHSVLYYL